MSLATQLIKKVLEEKKKVAQDEMGVPKYDNFGTPDNHVKGKPGTKPVANPAAGLGDRKDKKPTADVGSSRKEKGRDMGGVKNKPKKVSEAQAQHPAFRDLGLQVQGNLLQFHAPGRPEQHYNIEYNQDIHNFLVRSMARSNDPNQIFELLMDYYEEGEGQNPYDQKGLAAGVGDEIQMGEDDDPCWSGYQMVGMKDKGGRKVPNCVPESKMREALGEPDDGKFLLVWKGEVVDSFDDKKEAEAMSSEYNMAYGGGVSIQRNRKWKPQASMGEAPGDDPYPFHKDREQAQMGRQTMGPQGTTNVRTNVGAGKKAQFGGGNVGRTTMDLRNSVGESVHKTADGEMDKSAYSTTHGNPAKTAKTRTTQKDEPANKGNPGTPKKGEKRASQGGHMDPNPVKVHDFKGGENEHKSMKKMHENVKSLESLLGRKLQLKGIR